MKQDNNYKQVGEKANEVLLVRLSKTQKTRLRALSEASGFKTLSDYVRIQLLNPSIEMKLNNILNLLQEGKIKTREKNKI